MASIKVGNITLKVAFDVIDIDIIQLKTPVRSGALRDGFIIDVEGAIVNNVDYASFVEFGTVNMAGRFMVTQSLPEIGERLAKKLAEQLDTPKLITLPELKIKVGR